MGVPSAAALTGAPLAKSSPPGSSYAAAVNGTAGNLTLTATGTGVVGTTLAAVLQTVGNALSTAASNLASNIISSLGSAGLNATTPQSSQSAPSSGFPASCSSGGWNSSDCYNLTGGLGSVGLPGLVSLGLSVEEGYAAGDNSGYSAAAEVANPSINILGINLANLGVSYAQSGCTTNGKCSTATSLANLSILNGAVTAAQSNGGALTATLDGSPLENLPATPANKVELCHATDSQTNQYVDINVAASAAYNADYLVHTGPVWYSGITTQWGDIIPPFTYNGQVYSANWNAAGQAIFNNGCAAVGALGVAVELKGGYLETTVPITLTQLLDGLGLGGLLGSIAGLDTTGTALSLTMVIGPGSSTASGAQAWGLGVGIDLSGTIDVTESSILSGVLGSASITIPTGVTGSPTALGNLASLELAYTSATTGSAVGSNPAWFPPNWI